MTYKKLAMELLACCCSSLDTAMTWTVGRV